MKRTRMNLARMTVLILLFALVTACGGDVGKLKIKDWGPRSTVAGDIPNRQPNGVMGLWINASGADGFGKAQIIFDGQPATTTVSAKGLTAAIAPEMLAKPGKKEVAIKQVSNGKILLVGTFVIHARGAVDLKVENWGPRSMVAGDIPNKQPDGVMGLWIKAPGADALGKAEVLFDNQPALTTISEKGLTAAIAPEQLTKPGKIKVAVKQVSTGKIFPVGAFEVQAVKK